MTAKKKITAEQKLDTQVDRYHKKVITDRNKYNKAKNKEADYQDKANKTMSVDYKKHFTELATKWGKAKDSSKKSYDRDNKKYKSYKAKQDRFDKTKVKRNLAKVATKISEHGKQVDAGKNEGKVAIYRSDGNSSDVVYIATTGGENDDTTSDVSTWPRDEGAPARNYARVSGKTVTASATITGKTDHESREKYNKLLTWNSRHYELTFKGKIYYKHLLLTDIGRTYDDYATDIKTSLTFQFSYPVKVTSETGTKKNNSTVKSTKSTQGTRSKTYKTLTIKSGMTYWQLAKKYGKSVAWLKKVNGYPAGSLPVGKKIRAR